MSGHSKWKTNKGKKSIADAKKSSLYTKIIKELVVVAREGGGNPDTNSRLRAIMQKAKEANMPSDNVKTAIKRGTGEIPGIVYESAIYEAYGPGGVALLVDTLSDNKNRTSAELRSIMSKKGGNFASPGAVSWMFVKKGYFLVEKSQAQEDDLMNLVLEAGAEDMKIDEKNYEVYTPVAAFEQVKQALDGKGIKYQDAEVTMIPNSTIKIEGSDAKQILNLIDTLEDHDDVQQVYANFDISDEIMEQLSNSSD